MHYFCGDDLQGMERDCVTIYSHSEEETLAAGEIMGRVMKAGDIAGLTGELGAGKTCLTRGIAKGLGVSGHYHITSPTFTLINEYPGRIPLYHMDMYRLAGTVDIRELGFEDYVERDGVIVIEWSDRISDAMPDRAFHVAITHCREHERKLAIEGEKDVIAELAEKLREGGLIETWR